MATIDTYLDELLAPELPPAPRPASASAPAADAPAAASGVDAAMAELAAEVMAEVMADAALSGGVAVHEALPADSMHAACAGAQALDVSTAPREAPAAAAPEVVDPPVALPRIDPAPAAMRAPGLPDLSAFMPPSGSSISPVARMAVAAASAARTRTATGGHRWLRVCVGGDSYAFELLRVQEVVRVAPVVAMRGAGHAVLGVMNLRGRIVPVFDLGLWLDVGAVQADERSRVVVIERNDELIGVLVTAVEDVVSLEREHVEPPLLGTDPGPTLGVARVTAAPTVLLDADALFD